MTRNRLLEKLPPFANKIFFPFKLSQKPTIFSDFREYEAPPELVKKGFAPEHAGIDIAVPKIDDFIYSSGFFEFVDYKTSPKGLYAVLRSLDNKFQVEYWHLSSVDTEKKGQILRPFEVFARQGASGLMFVKQAHLHLQIKDLELNNANVWDNYVNPKDYFANFLEMLAYAISIQEGFWIEGTIADTHNNPFNLKYVDWEKEFGAEKGTKGSDGGYFVRFEKPLYGWLAGMRLLKWFAKGEHISKAKTIAQMIRFYTTTDRFDYLKNVCGWLGISPSFKLQDLYKTPYDFCPNWKIPNKNAWFASFIIAIWRMLHG